MGLDASYQALAGGAPLLELARRNTGVGGWLISVTRLLRDPREESLAPGGPDADELELLAAVRDLLRTRPDLATQEVDLASLAGIAIRGEEEIAPHVVAPQGVPLRYTRPETVEQWLRERFVLFRDFHTTAAKHGDGVLVRVD